MTDSSILMSVFFNSPRFTGSSGGVTSVIGRLSSVVVDLGFRGMTDLKFSSDQLFSASRRTLRACSTPSSSSVRSHFPSHTPDFHVCQLRCGISRSLSNLWKMCKNSFSKLHQFSSVRSAHGTIEQRLHITASETKNEPGCMSNNPSHQGAVGGWSVLCPFSHCRQQMYAAVPATSESFQLLRCSDVTVWKNFERLFVLVVWT